jgi:hypothetical protein
MAISGVLVSFTALGQDFLECVSPDVTRSLLMTTRDAPEYLVTGDVPPTLADFDTPAGFSWVGSRVTGYDVKSTWKSNLAPRAAQQAFNAALEANGFATWNEGDDSGFVLTSPPMSTLACRDSTMGVLIVRDVDGARYLTLAIPERAETQTCAEYMTPNPSFSRAFDLIPRLETPPEVLISGRPGALPTGSGSGSGNAYTSSIEVEGIGSVSSLVAVLGDQVRDQGWVADATWTGTHSAGSTWTRALDDGTRLAGKLTVQSIGSGYHELSFMLVPMN